MILTLIIIALDAFLVGMYLARYLEDYNWPDALIGFLWLACAVLNIFVGQTKYKEAAQIDTSKQLIVTTPVMPQVDSTYSSRANETTYDFTFDSGMFDFKNE